MSIKEIHDQLLFNFFVSICLLIAITDSQVFGLGNKTYEHYNEMGKYVDTRLEKLGATRVYELGLGDDDGK